jgi:hypothetical protein
MSLSTPEKKDHAPQHVDSASVGQSGSPDKTKSNYDALLMPRKDKRRRLVLGGSPVKQDASVDPSTLNFGPLHKAVDPRSCVFARDGWFAVRLSQYSEAICHPGTPQSIKARVNAWRPEGNRCSTSQHSTSCNRNRQSLALQAMKFARNRSGQQNVNDTIERKSWADSADY